MIRKRFIIVFLLTAIFSTSSLNVFADPIHILLQIGYDDPIEGDDGLQRGPVFIPKLYLDDYSLIFDTPCDGCTLTQLDEDGDVAYTTIIPIGTTTLSLPAYLSGNYEIQIIRGNFCFWGYFNLEYGL